MEHPIVSVIVRSVGRPELREALDAVAAQHYPELEIVVVDASGGEPLALPEHWGRVGLRVVRQGRRLSRSQAANAGLQSASGQLVGFLDEDDLLLPEHVDNLVGALARDRETVLAYAGVRAVNSDGRDVLQLNRPFDPALLRAGNYITSNAALFRRQVVESGCSFDEDLEVFEDWDFWLQLAQRGPFVHHTAVTAVYRAGGGSGIGIEADGLRQREGRACVLDKWRHRWSGAEIESTIEALNQQLRAEGRRADENALQLGASTVRVAELESELAGLVASASWRLTAPLRRAAAALRPGKTLK